MYTYVTPSVSAYQCRKIFYSNEKRQQETIKEWFDRVFDLMNGCEFGDLSDFMLIDKFITGLDIKSIGILEKNTLLSANTLLSIGFEKDYDGNESCSETVPFSEIAQSIDPFFNAKDEEENEIFGKQNVKNKSICKTSIEENSIDKRNANFRIKGFKVEKNKGIVCLDCGKCFKHKNSYNSHKRKHTGTNLYICNVCGKSFVKLSQLKVHSITHNHDNKSFECYLCLSKFDRMHGLKIHFTISHTVKSIRNRKCPMCSKTFSKQRDLDLHIKIHQGLMEGYKCQQCNKIYDKRSALNDHLVVHLKTREFMCEICGRAFKTKSLLRNHMQIHNDERRFKCYECGHVLKSAQTLKSHMRQHTGERPYECDLCPKTFVTRPSLIKHLRVHRQERPYGCSLCTKRFATNYHVKVHMNHHTGAKPYACSFRLCDKAFSQLGSLKAHQSKAHQGIAVENSK